MQLQYNAKIGVEKRQKVKNISCSRETRRIRRCLEIEEIEKPEKKRTHDDDKYATTQTTGNTLVRNI